MLEDDPLPHFFCDMYKIATELGIRIFYLVLIIQTERFCRFQCTLTKQQSF